MTALASPASNTSSPCKPPSPDTTAKKTSPSHSQDIHGAPADVYEYGSVVAQRCVERISSPVLMCHHMSGSTLNDCTTAKVAPTSSAPNSAGNEHSQRNNSAIGPLFATPVRGTNTTFESSARATSGARLLCNGVPGTSPGIAMSASLIFAFKIDSCRGCQN